MAGISGIGMMLKSLGIDPEEIKSSIEGFMTTVKTATEEIKANQKRLEAKDDLILARLDSLLMYEHLRREKGPLVEDLVSSPSSTKLLAMDGTDSGAILTDEKFPQEVLDHPLDVFANPSRENTSTHGETELRG